MSEKDIPGALEAKRSLLRLGWRTVLGAPAAAYTPIFLVWAVVRLLQGEPELVFLEWRDTWPILLFSLVIFFLLFFYWKRFGGAGPFLILSPQGLIIPSLGSNVPIPWSNVRAEEQLGVTFWGGVNIWIKVDPAVYARISHRFKNRPYFLFIPNVLDVGGRTIRSTIFRYQALNQGAELNVYSLSRDSS